MCGIVGYVGKNKKGIEFLLDSLSHLEYRGYDSSGIAYYDLNDKNIKVLKEKGRISNLKEKIDDNIKTNIGIGHTRWATHGEASKINAHPHKIGNVTIVHNGIIENYNELKKELKEYKFLSETDTEVAAALIDKLYKKTNNIKETLKIFQDKIKGSYAIAIMFENITDKIYAIKKNSPLIIGLNNAENYIASDIPAILNYTNRYIILNDNEFSEISNTYVNIYDINGNKINYVEKIFDEKIDSINNFGYEHFMIKEINEEQDVIKRLIGEYIKESEIDLSRYIQNVSSINKIVIIACGSAIHAGMIGKDLIEEYTNIPVSIEIASEFRYKKNLFIDKNTLVIAISQSGETADTLEALKITKKYNCKTLGIINVKESSIARICDKVIYIKAGQEIAVATTKAYLGQVFILILISIYIAKLKNNISIEKYKFLINQIKELPIIIKNILDNNNSNKIANILYKENNIFFIGRQYDYSLCMEGSLKLKEVSYIHSEAYQAGELKHGTISLIDKNTKVIAIATKANILDKTISNIKEVKSRGGYIILIANRKIDNSCYDEVILLPKIDEILQPIITVIPLQLIAYYTAKLRGCDIDKPKNLAKSVTVE